MVAGGGALWLDGTGPAGHAQLLKIDPGSGAISAQTTLPPGCSQAAYGLDHVWVLCNTANTAKVLRVDPATAEVDAQTGALPGPVYTFVAGSEGVWVGANTGILQVDPSGTRLTGLTVTGSAKYLSVNSADYIGPLGAASWRSATEPSGRYPATSPGGRNPWPKSTRQPDASRRPSPTPRSLTPATTSGT